jgi:hypothetical protein
VPTGKLEPEGRFGVRLTQLATVGAVHVTTLEHSVASNDTLMFVGQFVMTGAVLSVTTTLNEHVAVLFAASVAVYVTVVVPKGKVAPGSMGLEIAAQEFTVGVVHVTTFEHSVAVSETLMFAGQPEITGGVLSETTTLKEQVEVLFAASLAVYVTVVVPSGKVAPGEKLDVRFTQLSTVGAVHVTTFEHSDGNKETLMLEGQPVITGAVLSVTTTLNEQFAVLP